MILGSSSSFFLSIFIFTMHLSRAVSFNKYEAVKTLLDLGGSPNYRDAKGLTPLYLSVMGNTDPNITQVDR